MTEPKKQRIVLDVMGADSGEAQIVQGGLEAARKLPDLLELILVGRRDRIEEVLDQCEVVPSNIAIEHAPDHVPMKMAPTEGARMRKSSIRVGLELVRSNEASAFVSPGNTGAVMASSLLTLGRIEGVQRPAIASAFPTSTGNRCVTLDCGANADCKPTHLSQFAVLGAIFSQVILHIDAPRVGLLSIGEERSKGNELIVNTHRLLSESELHFIGNIEGRDILSGATDVAVTDGFTGNVLLKFAESIQPMLTKSIKRQVQTNLFSRLGATLMLPFLRQMRERFDYAEIGGAPLLGVNGGVIICHGSSSSKAIANAVAVAFDMASREVVRQTREELENNHFGQNNGTKDKGAHHRDRVACSTAPSDQR